MNKIMPKTSGSLVLTSRNLLPASLLSVAAISGAILGATNAFADSSSVNHVTVSVGSSCTMRSSGNNTHTAEVGNGTYVSEIGTTTITAICNDAEGFSIYAVGFTGDEIGGTNSTKLVGASTGGLIATGTATGSNTNDPSNWAMKVATDSNATYPMTLQNGFGSYSAVPASYTKVATRSSGTDAGTSATGATLTTTYAAYINSGQISDTYNGKVKYTLVHPANEEPVLPQTATSGCINYFANASTAEGTMGCQSISASATSATLLASNFSRTGYGFAGWSDAYDYATNANARFYGSNEDITFTAGQYTGANNGLALYAVWIKSVGNFQDSSKTTTVCNGLTQATVSGARTLASVSALTDARDNQTYAIAKLADGKCWMIENLRLDNSATLTTANTNNPLNDGTSVTLKHNYTDAQTYNTLSATSGVAYDADTAPDGWCKTDSAACDDQSRLRTDNIANRVTYASGQTMSSTAVNLYSYGNYYNWYSATAGRGTLGFKSNNSSTAGDLCPTNWRLPKGGDKNRIVSNDDNEIWNLVVDALNGGIAPANANYATMEQPFYTGAEEAGPVDALIRTWPNNFVHSGSVNGALLNGRGSSGSIWTSTAGWAPASYAFGFENMGVNPTGHTYKYIGISIRCLVSGM